MNSYSYSGDEASGGFASSVLSVKRIGSEGILLLLMSVVTQNIPIIHLRNIRRPKNCVKLSQISIIAASYELLSCVVELPISFVSIDL